MSDTAKKDAPAAAPAEKKGGGVSLVALIIPAVLAAGGAFGGAKLGASQPPKVVTVEVKDVEPPGPTMAVDPFLVTIADANQKPHAIKMTIALELKHAAKEEEMKSFLPRIRDSVLGYLRSQSFEDASNNKKIEATRAELKERVKKLGAEAVEQVLITDFVAQ